MDKNFRIVAANRNTGAPLSREEQYQRRQSLIPSEDPEGWPHIEDDLNGMCGDPAGSAFAGICGAIGLVALMLITLYWLFK